MDHRFSDSRSREPIAVVGGAKSTVSIPESKRAVARRKGHTLQSVPSVRAATLQSFGESDLLHRRAITFRLRAGSSCRRPEWAEFPVEFLGGNLRGVVSSQEDTQPDERVLPADATS